MNLIQLFYHSVMKYPDKKCILYKRDGQYHSYTYEELWSATLRFAAGLKACGIEKGDHVGLLSTNCPEWPITDLAAMTIQAVVVPVYPTLPSIQVHYILQHAGVKCVIAQDESQLEKLFENWPDTLEKVILIRSEHPITDDRVLSFSNVLYMGNQFQKEHDPSDIDAIPEHQLATIVYTSGTSGTPKGVMLTHKNIVSNILASTRYLPVNNSDTTLSYLPLSHIFERTVGQFAAFTFGATIAYAESIETILENLQEVRPTLLVTVPRLLEKVYTRIQDRVGKLPKVIRLICESGFKTTSHRGITYRLVDLLVYKKLRSGLGGNIRMIVSGGAGLAANITEFFAKSGIPIYEGYGMTETSPVICVNPFGKARPGTVGLAIPGVELAIAEDGELLVKGPNVMLGYYDSPAETEKTITKDGWLHTGDVAEIKDSYVRIVDRKKNLLVLSTGKNVAPWPIENAISLSTYISEVILIGDGRQYVTCLVFPDFQTIRPLAEQLQLGEDRGKWVAHPRIQACIQDEIASRSAAFASFERPKRAVIIPSELSIDTGELTPTLKIRNQMILKKYADVIDDMYKGLTGFEIFRTNETNEPHKRNPNLEAYITPTAEENSPSTDNHHASKDHHPHVSQTKNNGQSLFGLIAAGILVGLAVRLLM
jgi:long-chain acyl-CoA synthetase